MVRYLLPLLVTLGWLSLPAFAQPNDWLDDFSTAGLDSRWEADLSTPDSISVDAQRQVLVIKGGDNSYNHLETPLPADVSSVQVDMSNITDTSASWSPGIVLYWGPSSYLRVMLSFHYGLRLEQAPGGEMVTPWPNSRPMPDTWYRLKLQLTEDTVTLTCAEAGTTVTRSFDLPRQPEWRGPCRLIVGKGYMPPEGGRPDFDNSYFRNSKSVVVYVDNVVIGRPADLEPRLAVSTERARVEGAVDPASLRAAVWPNVLSDATRGTVWLAQGAYQRLCLLYANHDGVHSARRIAMEVELSPHLVPSEVTVGTLAARVRSQRQADMVRLTVDFPTGFVLPAGLAGVDRVGGGEPGWLSWPVSPMTPPVFIHCRPRSQDPGRLRVRMLTDGRPGPWTEMRTEVLPPVPPLPQTDPRHLGLSMWEGGLLRAPGIHKQTALAAMLRQYQQVGLARLQAIAGSSVARIASAARIHVNLTSWWHYSAQCPPDVVPTADEKATDANPSYTTFCPEVIATGAGTYGRFLETVTARMQETGADGFMLDYECAPPLCYCQRCRQAFSRYTHLTDAVWPEDVKRGGRYYGRWIDFRCDQGARYVKVIGEAARLATPGCPLQAWIAGYDYEGSLESAQIDISKAAAYLTEPEVPHYTLPGDYGDMWTADAGSGSVEAGIKTVQDSLNVTRKPLVFCSSVIYPLGSGTPWSDPQILNAQMLAVIGQGVRGISFWGGHDEGALDGRYLHMLARWNAVLAAADPFLWDGRRDDSAVAVTGTDGNRVRKYVWLLGDRAMVFVVNLTQEDVPVTVAAPGFAQTARLMPAGREVSLSRPLTVPALDGLVMVTTRRPAR